MCYLSENPPKVFKHSPIEICHAIKIQKISGMLLSVPTACFCASETIYELSQMSLDTKFGHTIVTDDIILFRSRIVFTTGKDLIT